MKRALAGFAVFAACCLPHLSVAAQAEEEPTEEQLEQARAQFGEGVELVAEERWAEALERFRAVAAVRAAPPVLYNLALARSHTEGGGPEAARVLERVLRDPETDAPTRRRSQELLDQIEPTVGSVVIQIIGDEAGAEVTIDGEPVGLADIGRPYRVTPGDHTIELRQGAAVRDSEQVSVAAQATEQVQLSSVGAVASDELLGEAEDGGGGGGDVTEQWWFWTAIAAGVLVAGGIVIGVAVSADGDVQPVNGNLDPGVLMVMP